MTTDFIEFAKKCARKHLKTLREHEGPRTVDGSGDDPRPADGVVVITFVGHEADTCSNMALFGGTIARDFDITASVEDRKKMAALMRDIARKTELLADMMEP